MTVLIIYFDIRSRLIFLCQNNPSFAKGSFTQLLFLTRHTLPLIIGGIVYFEVYQSRNYFP